MLLPEIEVPITEREFRLFSDLVRERTGISLTDAKRAMLSTRLLNRLRHHGYESFERYYRHLQSQDAYGQEFQQMINALTTNMTSFFRERHHFDVLARQLLLPVRDLAHRERSPSIRVWSAGCSTGEEAYSIAMTVADNLDHLPAWDVKILATDIDTEVLQTCRCGIYPRSAVNDLMPQTIKKHFLCGTGKFDGFVRIKPDLTRLVTFGHLNLMAGSWPFHGKFDAIFCRNVIIYFDHEHQHRLLEHFVRYIKPGGLFFAGHSENLFWLDDLLEPIGHTVYRIRKSEKSK